MTGLAAASFCSDRTSAASYSSGAGAGIGAGQINASNMALNSEEAKGGRSGGRSSKHLKRPTEQELKILKSKLSPEATLGDWNGYPVVIEKNLALERISTIELVYLQNQVAMTTGCITLLAGIGLITLAVKSGKAARGDGGGCLFLAIGFAAIFASPLLLIPDHKKLPLITKAGVGEAPVILLTNNKATPLESDVSPLLVLAWKEDRYIPINWIAK